MVRFDVVGSAAAAVVKQKRVTVEKKLDAIIEHLTGVIDGGYPGESLWIGNTLAYTGARGGSAGLEYDGGLGAITRREMLAWYDRAAAFVEDNPDYGLSSAFHETHDA